MGLGRGPNDRAKRKHLRGANKRNKGDRALKKIADAAQRLKKGNTNAQVSVLRLVVLNLFETNPKEPYRCSPKSLQMAGPTVANNLEGWE